MRHLGIRPALNAVAALTLSGAAIQGAPLPQQDVLVGKVSIREAAAGWVGFGFDQISTGDSTLILVNWVHPESPAARAGLRQGDRVVRVNGTRVTLPMIESMGRRVEPGDPYTFDVLRRGDTLALALVAGKHPGSSNIIETRIQSQLDTLGRLMEVTLDSLQVAYRLPQLRVRTQDAEEGTVTLTVSSASDGRGANATTTVRTSAEFLPRTEHFAEAWVLGDSARTLFKIEATGNPAQAPEMVPATPLRGTAARAPGVVSVWNTTSPLDTYAEGARRVAGAELHRVSPDLGRYLGIDRGLLITEVAPGTPAARSGLRSGDVLLAVNGTEVESLDVLRKLLSFPTRESVLSIHRRGEVVDVALRR